MNNDFSHKMASDVISDLVLASTIADDFNVPGVHVDAFRALCACKKREDGDGFARVFLEVWNTLCGGLVGVAAHDIDEAQEIMITEIRAERAKRAEQNSV